MIERYRDHYATTLFSTQNQYANWRAVELAYLRARLAEGDATVNETLIKHVEAFRLPTDYEVSVEESDTGHDVVAFLRAWTKNMSPEAKAQIHRGLTSSDLVENTLFQQLRCVTERANSMLVAISDRLMDLEELYRNSPRMGRTHGQDAEPTTLGWRIRVWRWTLGALRTQGKFVMDELTVMKSPGATGNMRLLGEMVALRVAVDLRADLLPSTQVIPRQRLIMWAGWLVAIGSLIEEIALEIRLSSRSDVGEMMEGAANDRVGSSAMPHKKNPIGSERLSGLGRLVRSNFAAIAETAGALHHERDISNSSVERVAVPDLSHLILFMLEQLKQILGQLRLNEPKMNQNARMGYDTALVQYRLQGLGLQYDEAQVETAIWARNHGWDYRRIIPLLNHRRYDLNLPLINSPSEFLDAINS